ncbi:hypothetical protein [Bradyrhizobium ivorense]|uniref:hypothetical protein n=1 Tax=Bradyrhizobium ivorense TaxID=2511166 RepID=UPI0010B56BCA|nr:hypothetical protein [Bradyrhizobium ivorense]VIO79130.1 hypothetical protein CI41S_66980 [Bradyrhizobium ivorense]
MKSAPSGWKPHEIVTRIDGWVVDPQNDGRIPAAVAAMIARAKLPVASRAVAIIRARMLTRYEKELGYD